MAKKQLNAIGIVFAAAVLVGFILVIVGMCTGVVTAMDESTSLFDEGWGQPGMPSNAFAIVAFIVAIIGCVVLLANAVLKMLGKEVKFLGFIGGAVTVVGGILILVAGLVLASDLSDIINVASNIGSSMDVEEPKIDVSAGVGVWLGFIGGLVAGAAGILSSLKMFNKD